MPIVILGDRGNTPTVLTWHPKLPLLSVGWRDGKVSFWSVEDRRVNEDGSVHEAHEVSVAQWSPDGTRLITGDVDGRAGGGGEVQLRQSSSAPIGESSKRPNVRSSLLSERQIVVHFRRSTSLVDVYALKFR